MNRQEQRYGTFSIAHLSGPNFERHQITVRDVSKTGARVSTTERNLSKDDVVILDFGGGDLKEGTIIWVVGTEVGILFR